jgi:hypothetical protein
VVHRPSQVIEKSFAELEVRGIECGGALRVNFDRSALQVLRIPPK